MGISLLTVPLTLTYLGSERYGMWLTISSLIALLSFMDLGIGNGLLTALTHATAKGAHAEARRQTSSALAMLTIVAVVCAVVFALCYPVIPWPSLLAVSSPEAAAEAGPAVALWAGCFLLGLPLSVAAQVRLARQEGYIVHLTSAVGNLVAVFGLLAVIISRQGVPALVVAMAGPPLVTSFVNGLILFKRDARELHPSLRLARYRTAVLLLRSGFLFLILQGSIATALSSDTLIVAQLIGPEAVTEYGVTAKLFMIPSAFVALALSPLWPAYGEAIAQGDVRWVQMTLRRSVRGTLFISVPTVAVIVALGQPLLALWLGPSVTPPFSLLVAFGTWVVMSAVGSCIAMLLNGANEIRLQAVAAVAMAVANLGLGIWLTTVLGVAGVMWGTVLAYGSLVLVPMAFYVPGVLRRIDAQRVWRTSI